MNKSKILVVDSEELIQEGLKKILDNEGYGADAVGNPSEALKYISKEKVRLIITEIRFPEMTKADGFEYIKEIKKVYEFIPIIVVTATVLVEDYLMAMNMGADEYIVKPFRVQELLQAIKHHLETKNFVDSVKDKKEGKKFEQLITEEKKARIKEIRGILKKGKGNPFLSKTGIEPRVFGGRTTELEFFESKLDEARNHYCDHFLVLGNWGVGKSTLLKEFKKKAQEKGYPTALVEIEPFQQGSKVKDGVISLIQGIYGNLPFEIDKMKSLHKYLKSIGISILGTGFNIDTSKPLELQPQALLLDALYNLWQDLKSNHLIVIFLDDVQYFEPILEIFTTIKQTLSSRRIQDETKYLFVMSCTPEKWYKFISMEKHHPVGRYFMNKVELNNLTKEELTDTILRSLEESDVVFDAEILQLIYKYTFGHPFEMQVLCSNLYDYQIRGKVDKSIWDKALYKTLKDLGDAIFKAWYEQASENEKKILKLLATSDYPIALKGLKELIKLEENSLLKGSEKYLQRLLEKNLISRTERGVYTIPDKMFQAYIKFV